MMAIIRATKDFLKFIFPPPTKSFIREINDLRCHLFQLEEEHQMICRKLDELSNKSSESIWADIFNSTVFESSWLKQKAFSPGRWALGYAALYVLYRTLNGIQPKHILELGLGQSTNMITQYATANIETEHYVVEHDHDWIMFYKKEYPLSRQTKVVNLNTAFVPYKETEAVRVFQDFKNTFSGKQFDLIVIDAPFGDDMPHYARIDILELLPECLCDSFVILIDDSQRSGEKNTVKEILSIMDDAGIAYAVGNYVGEKSTTVICSKSNTFLTTL